MLKSNICSECGSSFVPGNSQHYCDGCYTFLCQELNLDARRIASVKEQLNHVELNVRRFE